MSVRPRISVLRLRQLSTMGSSPGTGRFWWSVGDNRPVALPAIYLLVTMFFWGTAFRASVIAADHASPIMVTALRAALAAGVLVIAVIAAQSAPAPGFRMMTIVTGLLMVTLALEGISEGAARAGPGPPRSSRTRRRSSSSSSSESS